MRTVHRPRVASAAPEHAAPASRAASGARPGGTAAPPPPRVLLAPSPIGRHCHRRRLDSSALRATLTASASASLMRWLVEDRGMETPAAEPGQEGGLVARRAIAKGEVRMGCFFFFPSSTSLSRSLCLSPPSLPLSPSLSPPPPSLSLSLSPSLSPSPNLLYTTPGRRSPRSRGTWQ